MNKIKSNIYSNIVTHQRFFPFKYKFSYYLTSLYIYHHELKLLDKNIKFFSYNKFNVFSFYEKDHGYRDNRPLNEFVADILNINSIKFKQLSFTILCFPRIFGYVFNPLSVIYCFDEEKFIAVLYEVKNTHNEQHTYCFANNDSQSKSVYQHKCKKIFYVSPFIKMNCFYKFSIKEPSEKLSLLIEQFDDQNKKVLLASQIGKKRNFLPATIMKSFIANPLMTIRVIFGIHYQAFRILFKGGKYYSRNKKPIDSISFEGNL